MLSKSDSTKPTISICALPSNITFGNCNVEYLGNGQILICIRNNATVYLSIRNLNTNTKIKEWFFPGYFSFLSHPNEKKFLLYSQDKTLVLCKETLMTIQDKPLPLEPHCCHALVDNQLFSMASDMTSITLYDLTNDFAKKTIPLLTSFKEKAKAKSIKQLANGLIACEFAYSNCCENEIILLELIKKPFLQCVELAKETLMTMEGWTDLPSGNILTYDAVGKMFQEWESGSLIKSWAFELECPLKPREKLSIYPLIDGEHLLLQQGNSQTLYSKKTGISKKVDLKDHNAYDIHPFQNGQLFIESSRSYRSYFLLVDFDEIQQYKNELYKTFNETILLEKYLLLKEIVRLNEAPLDIILPLFFPLISLFTTYKEIMEQQPITLDTKVEEQRPWCSIQ